MDTAGSGNCLEILGWQNATKRLTSPRKEFNLRIKGEAAQWLRAPAPEGNKCLVWEDEGGELCLNRGIGLGRGGGE